jgi:hypothetical protein
MELVAANLTHESEQLYLSSAARDLDRNVSRALSRAAEYLSAVRLSPILMASACAGCSLTGPFDGYADDSTSGGQDRCSEPSVVRCFGFDDAYEINRRLTPAGDGAVHGQFDANQRVEGAGSLRFEIPAASSESNLVGSFALNFSPDELEPGADFSERFGPGEEVYVQWRQRFEPAALADSGGTGFTQAIVGKGDILGLQSGALAAPNVQIGDYSYRGLPQLALAGGVPIQPAAPGGDVFFQNVTGCADPEDAACVRYHADQWMTFQIGLGIGHWGAPDSRVRSWVGLEGQPSILIVDVMTALELDNAEPDQKIGKVWFRYDAPSRPPGIQNPTSSFWVDDLVISRQFIADP